MKEAQYSLDITAETCPLTLVKTKLLLESMAAGEVACIRLSAGEPLDTAAARACATRAIDVLELAPEEDGGTTYRLLVRKG